MSREPTIDQLIRTAMSVVPLDETVAEGYKRLPPGGVLVVVDDRARPVVVLTEALLARLPDRSQRLDRYRGQFAPPALTLKGTSLASILQGLLFDKMIDWHIVFDGEQIVGVLHPDDLLDAMPDLGGTTFGACSAESTLPAVDSTAAPPELDYVCYHAQSHYLAPDEVARDGDGYALCPLHHARMAAQNPSGARREPPALNTRFDNIGPEQPLVAGRRVPLIISVGAPTANTCAQSSRPFTFAFPDPAAPAHFVVHVDGDPDVWTIKAVEPALIVEPPGRTAQEAEFVVTARRPGESGLFISLVQAATGAAVQRLWLPVMVVAEDGLDMAARALQPRVEIALPLDAPGLARPAVELLFKKQDDHFLVLVIADLPSGTIRDTYKVPIDEHQLQVAVLRVRRELERIVLTRADGGETPFLSTRTLTVDADLGRQAAVRLADAGEQLWRQIFQAPRAPLELRRLADELRALPHGSAIQVILDSQKFVIPWAFLYDKPGPITVHTLDWEGFWGYRYILDVLPPARYPAPIITASVPGVQLLFHDHADLWAFTRVQEQFVTQRFVGAVVRSAWGDSAVQAALGQPSDASFVYFYCQGDRYDGAAPYGDGELARDAALSFSAGRRVRLSEMKRLLAAPLGRRPLVFLNTCEGASLEPFHYDHFMPFFIEELGACSFISTEVTAPALLAHDFAMEFMARFWQGRPAGQILWQLRRHYLDTHHTILGFNYSLYGLGAIRLAPR
jgi:hypothetical protein